MLPLHLSSHSHSLNKKPFPGLPTHSSQCYQSPGHCQLDSPCSLTLFLHKDSTMAFEDILYSKVTPDHAKWNCVCVRVCRTDLCTVPDVLLCDRIFTPLSFSAQEFSSVKMNRCDSIYIWECLHSLLSSSYLESTEGECWLPVDTSIHPGWGSVVYMDFGEGEERILNLNVLSDWEEIWC